MCDSVLTVVISFDSFYGHEKQATRQGGYWNTELRAGNVWNEFTIQGGRTLQERNRVYRVLLSSGGRKSSRNKGFFSSRVSYYDDVSFDRKAADTFIQQIRINNNSRTPPFPNQQTSELCKCKLCWSLFECVIHFAFANVDTQFYRRL